MKDIENRNWLPGRNPRHGPYNSQRADFKIDTPCRIYVHAALSKSEMHDPTLRWIYDRLTREQTGMFASQFSFLPFGAIVGEVDITGVIHTPDYQCDGVGHAPSAGDQLRELEYLREHRSPYRSPWFEGPFGLVLANPVAYDKPIPYKGQLGFFEVTL